MTLYCLGHKFHYELENLLRLFMPDIKLTVEYSEPDGDCVGPYTITRYAADGEVASAYVEYSDECELLSASESFDVNTPDSEAERIIAVLLFGILTKHFNYRPGWGILTGVRPSKLMSRLKEDNGETAAKEYFTKKLLVSEKKMQLAASVAASEKRLTDSVEKGTFGLYISIPYCPTRCSYCSFVSHSVTSASMKKSMGEYTELLCKEIEELGRITARLGIKPCCVYWGGGTPTTLEAPLLDKILCTIESCFELDSVREYTVEAGRPDTVTAEKFSVLKAHGVNRISINPQTFCEPVLEAIGRKHTAEDIVSAFALAREAGFEHINSDLIAGLPGDSAEGFKYSLNRLLELEPDNITVHTLALKRSSTLVSAEHKQGCAGEVTAKMLETATPMLENASYMPYYMYRQSKSAGNLENVGWCKQGAECLYNVIMIEECLSVLSVGAGAVTKLCTSDGRHIERIFNFKYPYEYISRFDELINRKTGITDFFNTYIY